MNKPSFIATNPIQIWSAAARPKTLVVTLAPISIASCMCIKEGTFSWILASVILLAALGIQIGTNFANDCFDFFRGADTGERKGPPRMTQLGLISPKQMQWATFIAFSIAAILSIFLVFYSGTIRIAIVAVASILCGFFYTGGKKPLAYLGLGELLSFLFFGPIAMATTFFLQTGNFHWKAACCGIAPGCLSAALLCINNMRDVEEDRKAGKKTLCVRFGLSFGKVMVLTCFALMWATFDLFGKGYTTTFLQGLLLIPSSFAALATWHARHMQRAFLWTIALFWIYTLFSCAAILLSP